MQPNYSTSDASHRHQDLHARVGATCALIPGALTRAEAATVIETAEARGYGSASPWYPPSYRNNDRLVIDDSELAARLFSRMRPHLPATIRDEHGAMWRLSGLNERFRLCRYRPGQHFAVHRDGVFHRNQRERSRLTFMVYLNDHEQFAGGHTRFFAGRARSAPMLCAIAPRCGTLIVFDHTLWHDGEPVTAGIKYIMRSDIMYRRVDEPATTGPTRIAETAGAGRAIPMVKATGFAVKTPDERMLECVQAHRGYVWRVLRLHDGRLATSARDPRDCNVRIWRREHGAHVSDGELWTGQQASNASSDAANASIAALCEPVPGQVWTGARNGAIRRWDLHARIMAGAMESAHEGAVLALVALDRGRVASASADGTIKLWTDQGRLLAIMRGHTSWVWSLARLDDGRLLSAGEDGSARLWSPDHARELTTVIRGPTPLTAACVLSRDRLAIAGSDGIIRVRAGSGRVRALAGHDGKVVNMAALAGDLLASAGEDDRVRIWCTNTGQQLGALEHGDFATCVTALPDHSLCTTSYDGTLRRWRDPRTWPQPNNDLH